MTKGLLPSVWLEAEAAVPASLVPALKLVPVFSTKPLKEEIPS